MTQRQVSVQRCEGDRGKAAGVKGCYSSLCPLKSFPENFSRRGETSFMFLDKQSLGRDKRIRVAFFCLGEFDP